MFFRRIARWPSHVGSIQQRCVIKSRRLAPEISYFQQKALATDV
jgi:hypothetical protein